MPPVADVLPLERTEEELLLTELLEELERELLLPLERTAELLLELPALERTLLLLLRELLVPDERLLPEEVERSCCTAELLERTEEPLLLELLPERTEELLPEDRELEEPEPVDRLLEEVRLLCWAEELLRLLEELLERLLLPEERVCATMFSPTSMERTSIREAAIFISFLMASQF